MTWLRNTWYQAGWSADVVDITPLVRTILDEPILFYRSGDGSLAALLDRCPHRFAPLSAGCIRDEIIRCAYHGLAFGTDGQCVDNPHGAITSAMRVKSYPVAERHSAIWIWMGDAEKADPALIANLSFIDETPESARIYDYMPTAAGYELLVDNIMDLSHADFLHPSSIGGIMVGARSKSREDGDKIVAEWLALDCDPPPAFRPSVAPATRADIWTEVIWSAPALMVLGTAAMPAGKARTPDDGSYTLHNMTPESDTKTHYFICSTRRFLVDDADFSAMLRSALLHAFGNEDKPMLELQQSRIGSSSFWELNPILLPIDAAAIRVRRMLAKLIDREETGV